MFEKHNPEIGARPGTLAIPPGSPFPRVTVVNYEEDLVTREEITDMSELRAIYETPGVTWVDVQGLGDEKTIREIAQRTDGK